VCRRGCARFSSALNRLHSVDALISAITEKRCCATVCLKSGCVSVLWGMLPSAQLDIVTFIKNAQTVENQLEELANLGCNFFTTSIQGFHCSAH
jgi:hypothetical protein